MPRKSKGSLQDSSTAEGESRSKIRPKGVFDGQQVNIPVLPPCWSRGTESSTAKGESRSKIRPKGVVDGQQVNTPVLLLVGSEGRRRLS